MSSLLRSPLFVLRLLTIVAGAAACTSPTNHTASSDDLTMGHALSGLEKSFSITVGGSGTMASAGLTPAPPLVPSYTAIGKAEFDRIVRAAHDIQWTDARTCQSGAKAAISMHVSEADPKNDYTLFDDFYACETHPYQQAATGIDAVIDVVRGLEPSLKFSGPIGNHAPAPTVAGESVWLDDASFDVTKQGSGEVPLGSECAPGEAIYSVDVHYAFFDWQECVVATPGDPRLRMIPHHLRLDQARLDAFRSAAEAAKTVSSPSCSRDSVIRVLRRTHDATPSYASFADEASSCKAYGKAAKLDGLLAALESMTAP